jgi:dynein light intermediate chain 1
LIHYLKNDPGPQAQQSENDEVPTTNSFGINTNYIPLSVDNLDDEATNTLALSYSFIDVQDEENEGIVFFSKKKKKKRMHELNNSSSSSPS